MNLIEAFTVLQRRRYNEDRVRHAIRTVLDNHRNGLATPASLDRVKRATGLDPRKKTDLERLRRCFAKVSEEQTNSAEHLECLAGLLEWNMFQMRLAEEMHMDMMEWIGKYAKKARMIYEASDRVKEAVDHNAVDDTLLQKIIRFLGSAGQKLSGG